MNPGFSVSRQPDGRAVASTQNVGSRVPLTPRVSPIMADMAFVSLNAPRAPQAGEQSEHVEGGLPKIVISFRWSLHQR